MATNTTLNLLVIDSDQLYAEHLVSLLSTYYSDINLGFLDAKSELLRSLRHQWDVLLFGRAYDMTFTDVVGIVQEQNIDLPLICLDMDASSSAGQNSEGLPVVLDNNMIKALPAEDEVKVVIATRILHESLKTRRQIAGLQNILSEAEQRANILIKNSKSAVAYLDQGIHIFANDPYLAMFGFDSPEEIIGVPVIDLIAGGDNVKAFKKFLSRFDKGNRDQVEFNFESRRKDDTTFEAKLQLAAATLEGEPVTQIIIQQNNANAAELAKQLAAAQRKDNLTGLANRQGFETHFAALYEQIKAEDKQAALLYVRIDNIGKINSSLGLQGTDEVVKQVAYTLDEYFELGFVSRFSDSKFTVLLEAIGEAELKQRADTIREKISDLIIEVGKRTTSTTVSIGMAMVDKHSPSKEAVIERAMDALDQVMIETKNVGNSIQLYDPSQHVNSDDEALAEYLVNAISHNRFELLYQPIYDINADRSDFFGVYLRLPLSDGSQMLPKDFMSVAKSHQLLEKIDRWVLINACKQLSEVRKQHPESRLLVSLSSASLADSRLASLVSQLIKAVGGPAGALTIQFNEQDVVDYLAVAKKQFSALSNVDCQLSIHNFGVTSKSIETAEYVNPDMVYLAKGYVDEMSNDSGIETVKSLVTKANERGLNVLIPYIEDAATMTTAWTMGARYLQGYYLQEPAKTMILAQES
ncbi:EAL domain-containing protein [Psychrobacter pygoscelis]|uniref:EAL domain-containing protein n=2 Tax=Pseudomonadota TaxID=1224 RepID=UPI0010406ACB|nr:EAL domain-containing protein [Psychrobacter pygoscelis]